MLPQRPQRRPQLAVRFAECIRPSAARGPSGDRTRAVYRSFGGSVSPLPHLPPCHSNHTNACTRARARTVSPLSRLTSSCLGLPAGTDGPVPEGPTLSDAATLPHPARASRRPPRSVRSSCSARTSSACPPCLKSSSRATAASRQRLLPAPPQPVRRVLCSTLLPSSARLRARAIIRR